MVNKLIMTEKKIILFQHEGPEQIEEGLLDALAKGFVAVQIAKGITRYVVNKDVNQYFSQSGLVLGDKVTRVRLDAWKRHLEQQGNIVIRKGVAWVNITSGRKKGQLVKWDLSWNKA